MLVESFCIYALPLIDQFPSFELSSSIHGRIFKQGFEDSYIREARARVRPARRQWADKSPVLDNGAAHR